MSFSDSTVARRRYTSEERRDIVELSFQTGARLRTVAEQYGVCPTTLSNWRKSYRENQLDGGDASSIKAPSHAELLPVKIVTPTSTPPALLHRTLVRIDLPSGASVRIQSDSLNIHDVATLMNAVQR